MVARRRSRWRVAIIVLLAVGLPLLQPASGAGQAEPTAALPEGATRGSQAEAEAIVSRVAPGVGSLALTTSVGVALAKVTNRVAQAQAETLDLGIVGDLIVALGDVDPSVLPASIAVDNRAGDAVDADVDYPIFGGIGGGDKEVQATGEPLARASTSVLSASEGLVRVDAGKAEATTRTIDESTREARAVVTADVDIAGLVQLSGMRWEAFHRSGDGARAAATFEVGRAVIGGVEVPSGSTEDLGELINAALAPSGIAVQLPRVERTEGTSQRIRITELGVQLKDSPLGAAVLGPILELTREQRRELYDRVTEEFGTAGLLFLIADVGTAIVGGQGFLRVAVGGAEAASGDLVLQDLLGGVVDPPATAALIEGDAPAASAPGPARLAGTAVDAPREVAVGPLVDRCESVHEQRPLHCRGGALLPLGVAVVLGALGIGVLDLRHQRRRRAALALAGELPVGLAASRAASLFGRASHALRPYGVIGAAGLVFAVLAVTVAVPRDEVGYRPPATIPEVGAGGSAPGGGPGPTSAVPVGTPGRSVAGRTAGCPDRDRQVPNDPYSPPCYTFDGDNGGATVRGVTADEIHVSFRQVEAGSPAEIFAGLAGQDLQDSTATTQATLDALAEYFSDRFEFYGRRLKIDRFRGAGNGLTELLGGGKERATADAVRVAEEIGAFAELNAGTLPYADALAQHGVVNIGAPYPSRAWYEARAPYSWSLFPDGTNIAEATRSVLLGRFPPGSTAEFAGPGLEGKPRVFGGIVPENPEYQESVAVFQRLIEGKGIPVGGVLKYKLDLVSMPQQAANLVAQMKDAGVTSLLCFCDPAMLALGMIPKAIEQNYYPEWITAGVVFVDQDIVSQALDARQWRRAFGTAYNAEPERIGASYPYAAFKSVRPDDEPALIVEDLYYQLYLLSIGIQQAGPNLTPETFQAGLFAYQPRQGPRGTWDFGPGDHTPTNDYREVWWDPDRISTQNDRKGRWVELNEGRRYRPDSAPSGRAPFFEG